MFVKIEPSGCVERKGLVQIRFAMYLEPSDYGYEKHYVQVPIIPLGGYLGEVDEPGSSIDSVAYNTWIGSLPKKWQTNPFHNHFIYAKPETTDKVIMDIGEAFLQESYIAWALGQIPAPKNPKVAFPVSFSRAKIEAKVQHLKVTKLERKV